MTQNSRVKARTNKPKLGQNFLSGPGAAQQIVDALGVIGDRVVIEIGPGKGALTKLLAKNAGRLIAIEFDRMLAAQLRFDYSRYQNVEIIEADVLAVDFDTIVRGELQGTTDRQPHHQGVRAKVVGNIPYYITSDILLKLFSFHRDFDELVIMVQREVADRIAARPGTREYGLLTVTTQLYCEAQNLFTLPPSAFTPPPKVHSSVLRLTVNPRAASLGVDERGFIAFLKLAFGQKRKTLGNNLKNTFGAAEISSAIAGVELEKSVRAEAATLAQLAAIHKALRAGP